MISHTKTYGIYHWDTFDNEIILIGEKDTLVEARDFIEHKYEGRIGPGGADRVDIVDRKGNVVEHYNVR